VSLIAANPLPLLFLLGSELVLLPILDSGPLRRMVARRKLELARAEAAEQRQRLIGDLAPASAKRYEAMENLCRLIETNYQGLTGISQVYLSEQRGKLDTILQGYLNRLMAVQRYERLPARRTEADVEEEIEVLEREMQEPDLPERAAAALQKNLELKRKLLASLREVDGTVRALVTELDSIESLLEVLHQSSISLRDPQAISADLDAIVRHSEDSERIVREMESLLGSDAVGWRSDAVREAAPSPPSETRTTGASRPKVKGR
jgi:DNA repair exonuclease SbcCD ATPase subunit